MIKAPFIGDQFGCETLSGMAAQLRDEDRTLVGELVVTCAALEHIAIIAIIALDADFGKVDLAFRRMTHGAVLDTLLRLAPTFLPEGDLLDRWKVWIESAREIGRRRNEVVHTIWSSVGPDELEGLSRGPFRLVRMPRTEMEKLAKDAGDAMKAGLFVVVDLVNFTRRKDPKHEAMALEAATDSSDTRTDPVDP